MENTGEIRIEDLEDTKPKECITKGSLEYDNSKIIQKFLNY